jgi:hypothetical protein
MLRVSKAADGSSWLWYGLEPADLGVHVTNGAGITLLWKGGADINRLGSFFERAASQASFAGPRYYRTWFMTDSGPIPLDRPTGKVVPVPGELLSTSGFVQFECLPTPPTSPEDVGEPIFSVFSNLDQSATSLSDLQESVGVYLKPDDLPVVSEDLAVVVASISSRFFRSEQRYEVGAVLETLQSVQKDTQSTLRR